MMISGTLQTIDVNDIEIDTTKLQRLPIG